jgi:tRNA U34 5-methylaminomethyl-2-thiouridine-forming methyltransferase MnmC
MAHKGKLGSGALAPPFSEAKAITSDKFCKIYSKKEIVKTLDSSKTLFSYEFNEHYHSTKDGAFSESLYKHIIPAFKYQQHKKTLRILDICYGLGYNTLATLFYIEKNSLDIRVEIISPEFDLELINSLKDFDYPKEFDKFKNIIISLSETQKYQDDRYKIEILIGDARDSIPKLKKKFDIVYQDAFSPQNNPTLWTKEYFRDIKNIIKDDGVVTTYSISLATRLALYKNGFNLFLYKDKHIRSSTIASPKLLNDIELVDMPHKIKINPNAKSLRD